MYRFDCVTVFIFATTETDLLSETIRRIRSSCRDDDLSEIIVVVPSADFPSYRHTQKLMEQDPTGKLSIYLQKNGRFELFMTELPPLVKGSHFVFMAADLEMDPTNLQTFIQKAKLHPHRIIAASKWLPESTVTGYGKLRRACSRTDCVRRSVQIRLPVRVNLSGTWTDAMPYCIDNGGDVIHAAVAVDGELPVCVAAERLPEPVLVFEDEGASVRFTADEWKSAPQMTEIGRFNLHLAAVQLFGITSDTEITGGLRLSTHVEGLAPGSGLGVSSILLGGCFLALNRLFDAKLSMDQILHMVFVAEQKMQTGGGWQDQVGGLTAGLKRTTSRPGFRQALSIQPLPLSSETTAWFDRNLCLLHTGKRHFGRFIVHDVMHRYLHGDAQTLSALETLKALNAQTASCFLNGQTEDIAACLNRHFAALKQLSPRITDDEICHLETLCAPICRAVSICGAGGGGYLLACLREGKTAQDLRRHVRAHLPHLSDDCVKTISLWNESYLISEEETAP